MPTHGVRTGVCSLHCKVAVALASGHANTAGVRVHCGRGKCEAEIPAPRIGFIKSLLQAHTLDMTALTNRPYRYVVRTDDTMGMRNSTQLQARGIRAMLESKGDRTGP